MDTRELRVTRRVVWVGLLAGLLAACAGGEGGGGTTSTPATTPGSPGHGAAMGVRDGSVADVRALGDGPGPDESWSVPLGLNVCGRFIDPLTGGPLEVAGTTLEATSGGRVEIRAGEEVAGTPLLADYAEAVGLELSSGRIALPEGVVPAVLDSTDPVMSLAGATLDDETRCGREAASVQVWVYSSDAVSSGEGILVVRDDPELVPFAEEGMAVVVALSPESSLPTLPPAALLDR